MSLRSNPGLKLANAFGVSNLNRVVKAMIERKVPMEIVNRHGGTVLGQALWSAIHEHEKTHAEIIEALISGGAKIHPGTLEWWEQQDVPSSETKDRVASALRRALEK